MDEALIAHWRAAPGDVLGALFDHSALLVLALDAEGRVLRQSAALARLTGRDGAAMEGRPLAGIMPEASAERLAGRVLPELRAHGRVASVDLTLTDVAGRAVPVRLSAFAELDATGSFVRALALLTDQRETRAALEALDRKAAEAEEESRAKSRLLAALSHEIRTPMNAILGFAQLLELGALDATQRGHVRAILSAGEALMGLLADLLDASKVEAGEMRVEPRRFDLHEMLDEVARWWLGPAAEKGLALKVGAAEDLPRHVVSDRGRVQQVLNNYLANAVKYTPSGRIALSVGVRPGPDRAGEGAATICFRVEDTGPGIAAEDVARLYRPFVQVGGAAQAERSGWGLGLSICADIAEAMGAEVGVESEPGRGSVFWFDLPVLIAGPEEASDEAAAPEGPAAAPAEATPAGRVLVVEDDPLNKDVMRRILAGLGHEAEVASNGFEALEALESGGFDLVLMDVMMPGLDGANATRRLRASESPARDIPVIGCSAHVSPEAEARYRTAGMTAFLPKPVDRAALAAAVAAALRSAGRARGSPE